MITRELRVVSSNAKVGSIGWDGDALILNGTARTVFAVLHSRFPDDVLGPRLADDGWSNGYLYLADPSEPVAAKFNPDEPRNPHSGEWISVGGVAGALKDALKLAGRIDLDDNEHLLGSAKVDGDSGGFRIAALDRNGSRLFRIGFGFEGYGQRSAGESPAWDGNPGGVRMPDAERQRLEAEYDELDTNDDHSPESYQRLDDIRELLAAGEGEFNQTAEVDEHALGRLATKVSAAMAEATDLDKALRADPTRDFSTTTFTEGVLPGSRWGDIHYEVYLDEPSHVYDAYGGGGGPTLYVGVLPKDNPEWQNGRDWAGTFDAAETRKILRLLAQMSAPPKP